MTNPSSQALWAVACENTYVHAQRTEHAAGGCVVECKIELTFVKLGAAFYGIYRGKMEPTYVKLGAAYYGMCSARSSENNRKIRRSNDYSRSPIIYPHTQ